MRITMIMNLPGAGDAEVLRREVAHLRRGGHEVRAHVTFEKADAERFASGARGEADLVIAAGGDGTINRVANGIYGEPAEGERLPRMGIIPLGTGNDLAAGLGIPLDIGEAMRVAVEGRAMEMDVGLMEERIFLNVSTGGFGAEATKETGSGAKRVLGKLAYAFSGAKKFATAEPSSARFSSDGEEVYDGSFMLFAVGNHQLTGGGNRLTPRADPADGLLDLCIVKEIPAKQFVRLLPDLRTGNHLKHSAVIYRQASEVRVQAHGHVSVNADGDPLDGREFRYSIAPYRLSIMVPQAR